MASIRSSILRMVADAFPSLVYGHPRTYKVTAVRGDKRLDLSPPADAPHLPELDAVEQWGLGKVTPVVGSEVSVVFRDADPTRPIVVNWQHISDDDDDELSLTPAEVAIDADSIEFGDGPARGAARLDDTVVVLLPPAIFTGTINSLPASGMIMWSPPQTMGTITTASSKVKVQ